MYFETDLARYTLSIRYDCLPGINDDFKITDNETQITDWNNLYKVKQGVSAYFNLFEINLF